MIKESNRIITIIFISVLILIIAIPAKSNFQSDKVIFTDEVSMDNEFILIEYDGRLAVFKTDELTKPYIIINVCYDTLTEKDKEVLKTGMYIKDSESLKRIFEDYAS